MVTEVISYYNTATGKWVKVFDITVSSSSTSSDEHSCCASRDEDISSSRDVDEVTFDDNLPLVPTWNLSGMPVIFVSPVYHAYQSRHHLLVVNLELLFNVSI